jgi:hypothetical protein
VIEIGQLVILFLRGLLLWVMVPLAALSWLVLGPLTTASLGACVGWFDLNLVVLLQRIILPLTREPPLAWFPLSKMRTTEHRLRFLSLE